MYQKLTRQANIKKLKNPFSGKKYELNNIELSMYDYIIGTQMMMEMQPESITQENVADFQKGLDWLKENNPEAYSVLLEQIKYNSYSSIKK